MPERVILGCDHKRCDQAGRRYVITVDGDATEVILCPQHSGTLQLIMQDGRPYDPRPKPAPRPLKGTDRPRLNGLKRV